MRHGAQLSRLLGSAVLVAGLAACVDDAERAALVGPVYYDCADRSNFAVTFDNARHIAIIERAAAPRLRLPQQIMGSGFRYGDGANELTGKGREATWRAAGMPPIPCTAR
ncbi:MAG TPA: MliC family protein [Alphaproteobacteria bacterium]